MATNDMPIKKGMLLEMAPEFFVYEIMQKESPISLEEKYKNLGLPYEEKVKRIEYENT
eukprot:CAMPEP_0168315294 /NCGR_PEP_ID=MMETSP0210-20121227/10737_1 /TAXON_ID=40633 /ORGANISM="Condylostoma magnum, Strain COL2" /LENGTH=57 /DNA_ID=CAMNT_0008287587 /DNA_START=275 /DNA_END=448 /DNA_ORIENTATION=+